MFDASKVDYPVAPPTPWKPLLDAVIYFLLST